MIASLSGSKYFILNFQNEQMDKIEEFARKIYLVQLLHSFFLTIEFTIVLSFVLKKLPKWYYVLIFFIVPVLPVYIFKHLPDIYYTIHPFLFYLTIPIIEQVKDNKETKSKFSWKKYGFSLLRLVIAMVITFLLQVIIYAIKNGNLSFENHYLSFSYYFAYSLEYDIALAVILFTILLLHKGKGDSKVWTNIQVHGGSSQTSKMQSQKSLQWKTLTKTQRTKLKLLYVRLYLTQLGAFLLLMVLPFFLGKVLEFLVMYLSFAVARYLLGFKYSLHYKKESICITVGVIVFGILSLAVPFFYVVLIVAIAFGVSLAILLHLSYKYKGMWLFTQAAKPDKFALLYVFFDGDLSYDHVRKICKFKGLDEEQTKFIVEYTQGEKISYIAYKHNYSQRMTIYKLDDAIEKLTA